MMETTSPPSYTDNDVEEEEGQQRQYRDDDDDEEEEEQTDGVFDSPTAVSFEMDIPQQQQRKQRRNMLLPLLTCIGIVAILGVWWKTVAQERASKRSSSNVQAKEPPSHYNCTRPLEECLTDRMGHFQFLQRGQGICNDAHRFGLTQEGALIKETCQDLQNDDPQEPAIVVLHQDPTAISFQMTDRGHFQLFAKDSNADNADAAGGSDGEDSSSSSSNSNTDILLWEAIPTINIQPTGKCLSSPRMECPYLHLHKSGDLVLNSINSDGWSDRKVRKIFPDLFP